MIYNSRRIELVYKYLGLTQQQFADRLGFSRHRIQDYLKGDEVSARFLKALEKNFPQINPNYIRNREDNMLIKDEDQSRHNKYEDCAEKDRIIQQLEEKLKDKEEIIESLREQIKMYKQQLDDYADKSKRA